MKPNARRYMADRDLTGFKRCAWVGGMIITDEKPEPRETIFRFFYNRVETLHWTPPAGAECFTVWIPGTTPDPLSRIWIKRTHNPGKLVTEWAWSADEHPFFPEDFKLADSYSAALSLAVQTATQPEET